MYDNYASSNLLIPTSGGIYYIFYIIRKPGKREKSPLEKLGKEFSILESKKNG